MKSFCGLSFFVIILIFSLSDIHVTANNLAFECSLDINIPDAVLKKCTALSRGNTVGDYISQIVNDVFHRGIFNKCQNSIDRLCEALPEVVRVYSAGGLQQCKDDLYDSVCATAGRENDDISCTYFEAVSKIIGQPEKWIPGNENHVCALFVPNPFVCFVAVKNMCKHIDNVLVKNHCQTALEKGICNAYSH